MSQFPTISRVQQYLSSLPVSCNGCDLKGRGRWEFKHTSATGWFSSESLSVKHFHVGGCALVCPSCYRRPSKKHTRAINPTHSNSSAIRLWSSILIDVRPWEIVLYDVETILWLYTVFAGSLFKRFNSNPVHVLENIYCHWIKLTLNPCISIM